MIFPRRRRSRVVRRSTALLFAAGTLCAVLAVHAEEPSKPVVVSPAPVLQPARPYWPELTTPQREALAPLATDWERLDVQTKKKWIEIARRYPKMSAEEQGRTHERMREWALLTPDQRRIARDSYARIRAMSPEQRAEMLRKYRELPEAQREALTTAGRASKALVVPKPISNAPTPRRTEIREGAHLRNPAVAAQKSASPIAAQAPRPTPKHSAPAVAPTPVPPAAIVPPDPSQPGAPPGAPAVPPAGPQSAATPLLNAAPAGPPIP